MDALEDKGFQHTTVEDGFMVAENQQKSNQKESDILSTIADKAKKVKDVVVDETKTLAPEIKKTVTTSTNRLNSENRIFEAVPNSFIYYGLLGLGLLFLAKKL